MTFETRDGQGALFTNTQRSSDRAPTHTGHVQIDGTRYRLAAWVKVSANGRHYFSLAIEEEREREPAPSRSRNAASATFQAPADFDEEIPFSAYHKGNEYAV